MACRPYCTALEREWYMNSLPPALWAVLNMHVESAVGGLIGVSIVFAGLIFVIAARARSVEVKLILLGLVTGVAAVLYGNFAIQDGVGVQVTVPGGGVGQQVGTA